jgi:hypothetical protein
MAASVGVKIFAKRNALIELLTSCGGETSEVFDALIEEKLEFGTYQEH